MSRLRSETQTIKIHSFENGGLENDFNAQIDFDFLIIRLPKIRSTDLLIYLETIGVAEPFRNHEPQHMFG